MKKEQTLEFTRRISQANRSGLVVVMYDIFFAYLKDAREAYEGEDPEAYKNALRGGQRVTEELMSALDFSYGLAGELYRIYVFCRDALAQAMYKRDLAGVDTAERLMRRLYDAFEQVAAQDTSEPLMKNTQHVYAGYTYGRDDLVETYDDTNRSRGFLA